MRAKEEKLIITFPTTAAAMEMERQSKALGMPGRIIPTPTVVTATCGLAWMADVGSRDKLEGMLKDNALPYEAILVLML